MPRAAAPIDRATSPVTSPTLELDRGVDLSAETLSSSSAPGARGWASSGPLLQRIGKFVLLERLGIGGMGVVYAAFDSELERKVAIKLVATQSAHQRAQARLFREARAQGQLSHPNVVPVHQVGTLPEGGMFIVMELVKGQTLRAWQHDRHSWQDIVAIYMAAGEGLAAAHRGNIVHRDFKPDNVLIGEDGRPRVTDFGLAFAASSDSAAGEYAESGPPAAHAEPTADAIGEPAAQRAIAPATVGAADDRSAVDRDPPAQPADPAIASAGRRNSTLGLVAGTPGYMAPEQRLAGGVVDARTDQYAFCVALYEALHGQRPNLPHGAVRSDAAEWRRASADAPYPRWLWDVMMRGLSASPSDRFRSMDALLAELKRHLERGGRRTMLAVAATAAVAIAGITYALSGGAAPEPCPLATAELHNTWDDATKLRVRQAVLGTGAPFAGSVWASTEAAFDRYARNWLDAQHAACEATHVRHVQSPELLDRRTECLESRRRSFAAATEVLQIRPAQAAMHADDILSSLGAIELCADTKALLAQGAPAEPATPALRNQIQELRSDLAQARALIATGDVASAEPKVMHADRLATGLEHTAVAGEVLYMKGLVKLTRGELPEAIGLLSKAIERAVSSHQDELAVDSYLALALGEGSLARRPVEFERWLGQGEAWINRLGHASDPRRITLERARGNLQLTAGDAARAVATLTRGIEAGEHLWGTSDPQLIPLLRDRAAAEAKLQMPTQALADAQRALDLGIRAWGPNYPDSARTRRVLGLLYIELLGDTKRGTAEIETAKKLYSDQLGPDSIEVANCEQALSQAGLYRGDYADALEHAERAERIFAERLGSNSTRHGEALNGLGVLRFMRRDFAGSLAAYEAAYPIQVAALGADHPDVGVLLSNTGEALLALGRPEPAEDDFRKALAILRKALGPDHADLALPLKGIGLAQLNRGHPDQALEPLQRALALRTDAKAVSDPQELAEIQWGLARTLSALGKDPARARALAEAALNSYRGLGSESADRRQDISRWLLKQPPASR
jgi:serine/threonine protein kinase/tetratricopeptide (TPR) repeat protein